MHIVSEALKVGDAAVAAECVKCFGTPTLGFDVFQFSRILCDGPVGLVRTRTSRNTAIRSLHWSDWLGNFTRPNLVRCAVRGVYETKHGTVPDRIRSTVLTEQGTHRHPDDWFSEFSQT